MNSSPVQAQGNYANAAEGLKQAAAHTASNILSISGTLLLVIGVGILGLLATAADTSKRWKMIFNVIVLAGSLGLLALRHWFGAGAYLIAGIVLLLTSDQPAAPPDETPEKGAS
jgi:hypothetical protein